MNTDLLTVKQVRALLPVSENLLYDLAAAGEIDHYRIRGRIFIPRSAVEKFLREHLCAAKRNYFHRTHRPPALLTEI